MGIASSKSRCLLHHAQTLLRLSSTKAQVVSLPNDIIFDILSRIPVKYLCRLRCVSKEWCALISDPAFVAAHKSGAEPLLVVGSDVDRSLRITDMDGNVVKVISGMGCVGKLVCTGRDSLVCAINHSGHTKVVDLANGEVLATCQKKGLWGFGRTATSSVYKVIYINVNTSEILTVRDHVGWRPMQLPPTDKISHSSNPVVVNGVLYLILALQLDGNSVLRFDLASEEWMEAIKGPANVDLQKCDLWLTELNGSLCMVQPDIQRTNHPCTNIWLLANSNKSTWVKVYTIPLYSSRLFRLIPLRMIRDGMRLLFCRTLDDTNLSMVKTYDARRRVSIDEPRTLASVHDTNFCLCSLPQLESFV